MTSTSECVRELIERIAAGSGVDARVRLEEDAEGVSAKYVHEDLELVIGHQGHHDYSLLLDAGDRRPAAGLPSAAR